MIIVESSVVKKTVCDGVEDQLVGFNKFPCVADLKTPLVDMTSNNA